MATSKRRGTEAGADGRVTLFAYRYEDPEAADEAAAGVGRELEAADVSVHRLDRDGASYVVAVAGDDEAAVLADVADWGRGLQARLGHDAVAPLVRRHREAPAAPRRKPAAARSAPEAPPPPPAGRAARTAQEDDGSYGKRRILSDVLMVIAVFLACEAALTIFWQEPISALWHGHEQDKLSGQLAGLEHQYAAQGAYSSTLDVKRARARRFARQLNGRAGLGDALGRLEIKALGLNDVIVQGEDADELTKGPGHYESTPLPGMGGTVGIAGHRTTFGAPFRHIDRLKPADEFDIEMPYGIFRYSVQSTRIVDPDDLSAWFGGRGERLLLTACHPPLSAEKRIVVTARLVDQGPPPRHA